MSDEIVYVPSDAVLRFVVRGFEEYNGITATPEWEDKLRAEAGQSLLNFCFSEGVNLHSAYEKNPSGPNQYAITTSKGSFTRVVIRALAIRMHFRRAERAEFGKVIGNDFCSFIKATGGTVMLRGREWMRLQDETLFVLPVPQEHVKLEPLKEQARVVKLTLKKRL